TVDEEIPASTVDGHTTPSVDAGIFTLENNASLVQIKDVENSGEIIVKAANLSSFHKQTSPSPTLVGQTLSVILNLEPTAGSRLNKFCPLDLKMGSKAIKKIVIFLYMRFLF
uniref:hypothetical protein n=1 Tax=Seonamhaeicola sp. TaxID=1912245 RepID=UPI003567DD0B